jgi:hypothetical protein
MTVENYRCDSLNISRDISLYIYDHSFDTLICTFDSTYLLKCLHINYIICVQNSSNYVFPFLYQLLHRLSNINAYTS